MTELHVHIPDDVAQRLAAEADLRGTSAEDIAAEVLTLHVPSGARGYKVPRFVGQGHSGRKDLSERVEEILSAELRS